MGNQQSISSDNQFTASVSAFTSNNSNFTLPSNLTEFTDSIKKFITFHKNLQSVYTYYTENVLTSFTHKINNSVSILDALLQQTAKNTNTKPTSNSKSTDESKQKKDALKQLFDLGVFKTKIKNNEDLFVEIDTSFHKIHSQFISNLEKLALQTPIVSEYSVNTLDEALIRKQFLKNMETINSVLTRILFYRYCTLLNNYIMHLYAIYAKSQLEVFTSKIIKKKKQEEFTVIQKLLQDALDKTSVNYNVKISNAITSLNKKIITKGGDNSIVAQNTSENIPKTVSSNLANIQVLLESSFQSFVQSNNQTNEFFTSINAIIDKKIETIKTEYSNMDKTNILNTNITEALKKLESQIRESTLTPTSENLNAVVANITNVEEEKETLKKYLQMIAIQSNAAKLNTALLTTQHNTSTNV